ncbi:MAG: SDR family oxidoreductase [Hyphomonas sp.]|uniref:SDR family oxidoreductase n=1 Tax=Hyphomonas sp. TaxID=87 RepID=UPI00185C206C|nr:SDR family oxidoreductase [Hyphomonas sp.]MBA3069233.1 SDR family oxidoreductase [Hyphomonas sp.]MBU3919653.1 SDR family oxidoreductase [Alphaproteobacteria bacterium]MBU4061820.1 SDR family oxidoreductase [Alphaproteobacteria bacterium]MBU4163348.1 SDR family oxidoreductase [Alphaproteobacteria bacterium]
MTLQIDRLFGLSGKVALVTGGGRGLGKMIAEGFIAAGAARVYIASRNAAALEETAAEISGEGRCIALAADLSTVAGCKALAAEISSRETRLDMLVNNSGAAWAAPLENFPEHAWDKVFQLNLKAPFFLTAALLPLLGAAATPGDPARIVNVGSVAGEVAKSLGAYPYGLSKGALHQLTQMMAAEYAARHITANALAPGRFPSKMTKNITEDENLYAEEVAAIPLGRFGRLEDIAGAALFLTSNAGAYVTGVVLPVDGGAALNRG